MKKIIHILVLITMGYSAFAQTKPQASKTSPVKVKEGIVEFNISYPSLTPEMKQMESMLPKTLTVYFKNELSRSEMPTAMVNTIVLGNNTKKEMVIMMDMMGQKFAIKETEADMKKKEEEMKKEGNYPTFTITPSKETKTIAGYLCKKVIISYTVNGKTERLDCYYTDALPKMTGSGSDNPAFKQINGFLMEYNINHEGIEMLIQAETVKSQPVANNMFTIPDDYKVVTQEELAEMMGGGAGK